MLSIISHRWVSKALGLVSHRRRASVAGEVKATRTRRWPQRLEDIGTRTCDLINRRAAHAYNDDMREQ